VSEAITQPDPRLEPNAFKLILIPSTRGRFGLWNWAARKRRQKFADFAADALDRELSAVAKEITDRGGKVPQGIAEGIDHQPVR